LSQETESDDRIRYRLDDSIEPTPQHDERILRAFDEAGREIGARRPRRRSRWTARWLAIPAALAAGIVLVPFLLPDRDVPLRNGTNMPTVEPANASVLENAPNRLQWTARADAESYHVVIYGLDDELVYSAEVPHPANEVSLPPEAVARMQPGDTFYWLVEVEGAAGAEIGPVWFSIGGAPEDTDR